ncbi:MAG: SUMF1/EgtB/PvdO family nonheme iron enzyme [Spirochaetales bacterium]
MRFFFFLAVFPAFLASCAGLPTADAPLLVQLPAWASSEPARATAALLTEAWGKEVDRSGRYRLRVPGWFEAGFSQALVETGYDQTALLPGANLAVLATALKATHVGLLDVLGSTGVAPAGKVVAYYRVVEAASGKVVLFDRAEVAPEEAAAWAKRLMKLWRAGLPPAQESVGITTGSQTWSSWWASAPNDAVTQGWIARVPPSLLAADFAELHRLADLLQDRWNDGGQVASPWSRSLRSLQAEIRALERTSVASAVAKKFNEALAIPFGATGAETLLEYRLLDLLRSPAGLEASRRSELAVAFVGRFGEALTAALARHAVLPVPGGTFLLGSNDGNPDEAPVHRVTVSPFLLGRTEVTQNQYQEVMGTNPSLFAQGLATQRPVERVTWYDAVNFCNKLSLREGLEPVYTVVAGQSAPTVTQDHRKTGYRLPTEAEWEWAARGAEAAAGFAFAGSAVPDTVAWTDSKTTTTSPVGQLAPNPLGLYDLSGNVWEWCWDWYGKYSAGAQVDPLGPDAGVLKVGRGGSWRAAAWNSRVTSRSYDGPSSKGNILGFRVARSIAPEPVSPPTAK